MGPRLCGHFVMAGSPEELEERVDEREASINPLTYLCLPSVGCLLLALPGANTLPGARSTATGAQH
jgi:hypothetical protein